MQPSCFSPMSKQCNLTEARGYNSLFLSVCMQTCITIVDRSTGNKTKWQQHDKGLWLLSTKEGVLLLKADCVNKARPLLFLLKADRKVKKSPLNVNYTVHQKGKQTADLSLFPESHPSSSISNPFSSNESMAN